MVTRSHRLEAVPMVSRSVLALAAVVLVAAPSLAQDKKKPGLRDFPFWSGPKQPHAREFLPGLQATLQLTPEQIEKIEAACNATIDLPENKGKNAPGAAAANEKLHKMVSEILTPEQKKLIEKTNDAYAKAVADAGEEFQPLYAAAKGNKEEMQKIRDQQKAAIEQNFEKRLDGILSPEQKKAMEEAAAEIKKRNADKVKPIK